MQLSEQQISEIFLKTADRLNGQRNPVEFARAIEEALRAQADARPAGHFFKASRVHPWVQVEKECPNAVPLYTHPEASAPGLSEREIADTVNKVRDIALQFHATQQLRERIARVLVPILTRASAAPSPGLSEDEWLALAERHIRADWNSEQPDGYLNAVKALVQDAMSLTRASAATVGEASKLGLTGDRLTEEKAAHIMQRDGYEVTGYVLAQPDGRRCIVEKSAVRWLNKDQMWEVMHPSEAAQQQAEPVHEADYCTESNCRRCNTPKALRTPDMDHAGLGSKPKAAKQQAGHVGQACGDSAEHVGIQQAEPGADERAAYLFIAMDDDHGAHLTYCKDREGVTSAVGVAMYMPYDPSDVDQAETVSAHVDTLLEDGVVTFEGDPPLYLYRIASNLAAQSGQRAGVAEGWVLVPKKITNSMIYAASDVPSGIAGSPPHWQHVWDAMLAVAPTQQQEGV